LLRDLNMASSNKVERELDKILEFSLDIICTVNQDNYFIRVSSAVNSILGYSPTELAGKCLLDLVDLDDRVQTRQAIADIVNGGGFNRFENQCLHRDGRAIPILWSASWDDEEKVLHCIAKDGTAKAQRETLRRSLADSNQRYKYVTQATSDAIWDWDLVRNTLFWGEGFEQIFGYQMNELNPTIESWTNHIHPADRDRVLKGIYKVINATDTNWKDEYQYQRSDGTFADVVDRGFVIRDTEGKAIRMVGAMHDISERKRSLKELKQFADDLFIRNRDLQQFAYVVSHNLRSPVANIIGISNLMELEKDNLRMIERCISDLKTSSHRLDEVICDLSKILSLTDGSTEISLESVDLVEVLNNVQMDLNDSVNRLDASLDLPDRPIIIQSHKAYIYSILFNLIGNALKYRSDVPPHIVVSIRLDEGKAIIEIRDNGIGIDVDKYGEDLFKPYKRFNYNVEGKGLGLFLVYSHVTALGGEISVDSKLGVGTVFKLIL
jgi:PAS domain S-box-containing protein